MTNKPNQKLHYGHWLDGAREDQWQPFRQLDLVDLIKNMSLNSDVDAPPEERRVGHSDN